MLQKTAVFFTPMIPPMTSMLGSERGGTCQEESQAWAFPLFIGQVHLAGPTSSIVLAKEKGHEKPGNHGEKNCSNRPRQPQLPAQDSSREHDGKDVDGGTRIEKSRCGAYTGAPGINAGKKGQDRAGATYLLPFVSKPFPSWRLSLFNLHFYLSIQRHIQGRKFYNLLQITSRLILGNLFIITITSLSFSSQCLKLPKMLAE